jgi:hypothetical protein
MMNPIDNGGYLSCLRHRPFLPSDQRRTPFNRIIVWSRLLFMRFAAFALSVGIGGCGLHYYDPDTGVNHLWGVGHLKMKLTSPAEGVRATVTGVQLLGVGVGVGQTNYYAQVGWSDIRLLRILHESTCVRLDWPSNDMFSIRVGTVPPNLRHDPNLSQSIQEELCH